MCMNASATIYISKRMGCRIVFMVMKFDMTCINVWVFKSSILFNQYPNLENHRYHTFWHFLISISFNGKKMIFSDKTMLLYAINLDAFKRDLTMILSFFFQNTNNWNLVNSIHNSYHLYRIRCIAFRHYIIEIPNSLVMHYVHS